MVRYIEELRPELHLPPLPQKSHGRIFHRREVKIVITGTPEEVSRRGPDEALGLSGERARIVVQALSMEPRAGLERSRNRRLRHASCSGCSSPAKGRGCP